MSRSANVFLEDIMIACNKMEEYTNGMNDEEFLDNDLTVDAVIKTILVIGEAVKNVPSHIKEKYSNVEWRKMPGM